MSSPALRIGYTLFSLFWCACIIILVVVHSYFWDFYASPFYWVLWAILAFVTVVVNIAYRYRIRVAVENYLSSENIFYNQYRVSFYYRTPFCMESPIVISDFGNVPLPVGTLQPNLVPVQVYYTNSPQSPQYSPWTGSMPSETVPLKS